MMQSKLIFMLIQLWKSMNDWSDDMELKNLIQDSSFELNSWSGANYSTSEVLYGSRSLYFPVGGTIVATINIGRPILGHKYYGRRYIKTNGDNQPPDCRFELFAGDGPGLNWVFAWNRGNYPNWGFDSSIQTIDVLNGSNYYIRCFNVNATADTWIDGVMLIDLTACFGAGNEPSKSWCDENIPYFESSFELNVILLPSLKEITINPNPVTQNAEFLISVNVNEEIIKLNPEIRYSGEFYSGEV